MKSILLVGLSNFGLLLLKQLSKAGHQVMAVDRNEKRVNAVLPLVTDAQIGDSTNEVFLQSLGVSEFDLCFVAIGDDFQSSLETTSLLKELGAQYVISRADKEVQGKFLLRNGADEIINPEKQMAEWAAIRYASDHVLDYIKLDEMHAIYEVPVPRKWFGMEVGKLDIRKRYGINIMAVRENGSMNLLVTPDMVLNENKSMLVLGERQAVKRCFHL